MHRPEIIFFNFFFDSGQELGVGCEEQVVWSGGRHIPPLV